MDDEQKRVEKYITEGKALLKIGKLFLSSRKKPMKKGLKKEGQKDN